MSDWAVGDLAVCIESGDETRAGCVYTVAEVRPAGRDYPCDCHHNYGPDDDLIFAEMAPGPCGLASGANRFRKIDKQEACEIEFVTLLKRSKQRVSA